MNIITLDFETYFDDEYTLNKLTTEAYVRDERFEVHGCAIRCSDCEGANQNAVGCRETSPTAEWLTAREFELWAASTDFSATAFLCHHAHFDGLILAHHYGVKPVLWLDTLSMGRMLVGNHLSLSLGALAEHFGLGAKNIPYERFRGKHWDDMDPLLQAEVRDGCCEDVRLTWNLFTRLAAGFPEEEYGLVDATVRMFTEPCLVGNTQGLARVWEQEQADRAALFEELGVQPKELGKNWRFAELLRAEGVEPEQKKGKPAPDGTDRWIYSFAKTDDFMRDLLDGDNERLALLCEGRLALKSNGIQTRSERLGWTSTRGAMPVYLNYCGAHTTRWSGGDKVNWQNLKRGGPIAEAIEAPPGHLLVVRDASQIECRLLNTVAGQADVIQRFRNREDPYTTIASQFYGFTVTKAHEAERGTGKQLELSCGYGAGAATIKATAKKGTYGPPVYLTDEQSLQARDLYRSTHPYVVGYWDAAGDVLSKLHAGLAFEWGPYTIKDKRIYLPNGAPLIYESLAWYTDAESGEQYWRVLTRKHLWTKLYGAKLVENVIQALARMHVSQAWLRCREAGIRVVSMEHDKLIACVREHEAEAVDEYMQQEMSREPVWLPGVPLDSDGYISHTLAKQKE
jgi:DNA polymerase